MFVVLVRSPVAITSLTIIIIAQNDEVTEEPERPKRNRVSYMKLSRDDDNSQNLRCT